MFLRLVTRLAVVIALATAVGCGGNSTSASSVVTSSSPSLIFDITLVGVQ